MNKVRLEILGLSSSQSQSGSFALVLGEVGGNRRLPIIIGMFEAQAIAIEIEKITPSRPMTHDLFKSFGNIFDFRVEEIIISDIKEGVFFAQVVVTNGEKQSSIDSRPSDAIAIGLRFGATIYTYDSVLNEAGVTVTEQEEAETEADLEQGEGEGEEATKKSEKASSSGKPKASKKSGELKGMTVDKLNELLKQAIDNEDYERAARIRDELNKRN